jgi:membrane-associated phospholipid phosphatase
MFRALVVLVWPAAIIAILAVTALLARRQGREPAPATGQRRPEGSGSDVVVARRAARSSIIGMLLILAVGAVAVYAVTCLLGVLVVHAGPTIDKPIYTWMIHHREHVWKAVMNRLTKVGDTWTTWGACAAAAACLAAFYRKDKWLPPAALGAAIVIDHFLTLALRHTFHRLGPPDSPLGTYPSGGCDRIFVFYGLIAYLIWREVSGRRSTAIWSAGVVTALAFSEAYSRFYLTLHWTTDILSGLIYGGLILAVFIVTIRLVAGPGRPPGVSGELADPAPAPSMAADLSPMAAGAPQLVAGASQLVSETTGPQPTLQ